MAHFAGGIDAEARRLVNTVASRGQAELRRELAGPLAVRVVATRSTCSMLSRRVMLGWYDEIVAAVDRVSTGGEIGSAARGRRSAGDACHRVDRARQQRAGRGHGDPRD